MKYQINVIKHLTKSKYYKLIITYILFSASVILLSFQNKEFITINTYKAVIGTLTINNLSLINILWFLFQILINFYITYSFLIYDENHSIEYLILRINYNKLIKYKIIIILTSYILFKIIYYLITYFLFYKYTQIKIKTLFINLLIHLIVTLLTFILYKIKSIVK